MSVVKYASVGLPRIVVKGYIEATTRHPELLLRLHEAQTYNVPDAVLPSHL